MVDCLKAANESSESLECYESYQTETRNIVSATVLFMLIASSTIGNLLICHLFLSGRKLKVPGHYYLLSLAISDLLVAVISMPLRVSFELTGLTYLSCNNRMNIHFFMEAVDIICCISSVTNLTTISIDRLFGIIQPLKHKIIMTRRKQIIFITLTWFYSIILGCAKLIQTFYDYIIIIFTFGFMIPLIIITISYILIFVIVMKKTINIGPKLSRREWILIRTVLVVIVFFAACWAPFFVVILLYQYCLACNRFSNTTFTANLITTTKLLTYVNSFANPCIYGFFNVDIRNACEKLLVKRNMSMITYRSRESSKVETPKSKIRSQNLMADKQASNSLGYQSNDSLALDHTLCTPCEFSHLFVVSKESEV